MCERDEYESGHLFSGYVDPSQKEWPVAPSNGDPSRVILDKLATLDIKREKEKEDKTADLLATRLNCIEILARELDLVMWRLPNVDQVRISSKIEEVSKLCGRIWYNR